MNRGTASLILHPSSFILHPSSFILPNKEFNMPNPIQRHESHPEIGTLTIQVVSDKTADIITTFLLEASSPFILRHCTQPDTYETTLNYQWYHTHTFQPGEKLQWQTTCPKSDSGSHQVGPCRLQAEKDGREITWEISAIPFNAPPRLTLQYNLHPEEQNTRLSMTIHNHSHCEARGLRLEVDLQGVLHDKNALSWCSGPTRVSFDLMPQTESEKYVYTVSGQGVCHVCIYQEKTLLVQEFINMIHATTAPATYSKENRNVAVRVYNARNNKELKPRGGYYRVWAHQNIKVVINPIKEANEPSKTSRDYVETVKDIEIKHPDITISSTGKSDDREFTYHMKFLASTPLTTKQIILYTVKYEDSENRTQVLPLQLQASSWGLFLIGMLFILPNLIDIIISTYQLERYKEVWLMIVVGVCITLPFLYDRIQSRF
jgi:hypothetical protein